MHLHYPCYVALSKVVIILGLSDEELRNKVKESSEIDKGQSLLTWWGFLDRSCKSEQKSNSTKNIISNRFRDCKTQIEGNTSFH